MNYGKTQGSVVIRDVLVYANNFDKWSAAVEYAAWLAAAEQANLTAAYVYPTPDLMLPAYGASALFTAMVDQTRQIERESLAAEGCFVDWARKCGVPQANWQVAEGYLPDVLSQIGNWNDLLVLGRNGDIPWESPNDVGALVVHSRIPCIVIPETGPDPAPANCIALAWNGAPEGLRAIHSARPLLKKAGRVVLLNGHRRDPLAGVGWRPQFEIHAYLRRHGIEAETHEISATDAEAGSAILNAAHQVQADLLVMGAYGRNRFSEWAFGGATRHVLEHATLPVLMRH